MAETKLYDAISGLHETDSKIWAKTQEVSGTIGMNYFPDALYSEDGETLLQEEVTSVVDTDGKISDRLLPSVQLGKNGEQLNMLSNIRFIGNCGISQDANGNLIIRIGDNLNSSTFNTKDGQTDGTASYSDNSGTYPATRIVNGIGSKTIWLKGTTDTVTITTAGKIHFDDAEGTTFKVKVTANGSTTPIEYTCGPVTGNGTFGKAPCVLTVSNWAAEKKTSEGATGYEANISIVLSLSTIVTANGSVSFEVTSEGTSGAGKYTVNDIAYFLLNPGTKPEVSNLTAKLKAAPKTQTWAGITSVISGIVVYSVDVANLNTPATDQTGGASIQFDNSSNYAGDVAKYSQTTYDGTITKEAYLTTTAGKYTSFNVAVSGWNINDVISGATSGLLDENNVAISGLDVYGGTPNASITKTNRITLDSTTVANKVAYTDTAAPGTNDLMVYHGELQYPSAFITSAYFDNSSYVAPGTSGDKAALFYFSSSGTEKGGQLVINGTGLTTNVKSVTLGNSGTNLLDITSTAGIGTAPSKTATKLTFPYTFKDASQYIDSSTGCWVKIVLSGTGAKITSITRS